MIPMATAIVALRTAGVMYGQVLDKGTTPFNKKPDAVLEPQP